MQTIAVIWGLSLLSFAASTLLISALYRKRRRLKELGGDTRASVSIQFVMLLPLVVGSMLFVLEMTNFMIAVIGLRYATATAVRSAIVWLPAELDDDAAGARRVSKVRHAAVAAWMPYMPGHISQVPTDANSGQAIQYIDALHRLQIGGVKKSYLSRQYALANELQLNLTVENSLEDYPGWQVPFSLVTRTNVTFLGKRIPQNRTPMVTATVTGPIPLKTTFIGRMFGDQLWPGVGVFARNVTVSYSLPIERPLSDTGTIGLHGYYESRF